MTEKYGRSSYIRQRALTEGRAGGARVSKIVPAGRRLLGAFQGQGEVIGEVRGLVGQDLRAGRVLCSEGLRRFRDEVLNARQRLALLRRELRRVDLVDDLGDMGETRLDVPFRALGIVDARRDLGCRGKGGWRGRGGWRPDLARGRDGGGGAAQREQGRQDEAESPDHAPSSRGRRTMTVVPRPTVDRNSTLPWCSSTTRRTRASPTPVP